MEGSASFRALLYRRQFVIGPRTVPLPSARHWDVGCGHWLTAHDDLSVTQVVRGGVRLTLLGHVLDPHNVQASNRVILDELSHEAFRPELLDRFGGRWVLIVSNRVDTIVYPDPAGTLQVYYARGWCGSNPDMLSRILGLFPDGEALSHLEVAVRHDREFWWPGRRCLYREVSLLWPNHCLSLSEGSVTRFWPHGDIPSLDMAEAAQRVAALLEGIIGAASRRFPLALPITSGLDSRTLLAACRGVRNEVYFYTAVYWDLTESHADVRLPRRMLRHLGLPHHLLVCPSRVSADFQMLFTLNLSDGHPALGLISEGTYQGMPPGRVSLRGTVSEIGRQFYRSRGFDKTTITAEDLAGLYGTRTPFARDAFQEWLDDVGPVRHDLLDWFYWEIRMGSWAARAYTENDIAQDLLAPFNCRLLLATLLGVDPAHRRPPRYELYRRVIELLWPELLKFPVNPKGWRTRIRGFFRRSAWADWLPDQAR